MSNARSCFSWFFIYALVSVLSWGYVYHNAEFNRIPQESVITKKWTEWRNNGEFIVYMAMFEGEFRGEPFYYTTLVDENTYKNVPFGTPFTLTVRPYELTRDQIVLFKQVIAACLAVGAGLISLIMLFSGVTHHLQSKKKPKPRKRRK